MSCASAFRNSAGAFFVPLECADCKLLVTEKTSERGIEVYFCRNLAANSTCSSRLLSVIDGDTLVVELSQKEHVRLLGIDAPEKLPGERADDQCAQLDVDPDTLYILAKLAKIHLWGLCPKGSAITLQTTGKVRDDYSRILAGVFRNDQCLNRLMVADGYAMAYRGSSDWNDYSPLEQAAKEAGKGIWGACEESFYAATTRSYHRPGCYYAKWASSRFASRLEAQDSGLSPCAACLPDFKRE